MFCANTDLDGLVDRLELQLTEAGWPAETVDGFVGMIRKFNGALDATARLSWAQRQVYIALANDTPRPKLRFAREDMFF